MTRASYDFLTLDVFTTQRFAGNPLAVFPEAEGLDAAAMQAIAAEFNLSETVFVLPPQAGGDGRLRIFTPTTELPFAGHPTIGTALALHGLGRVGDTMVLEEGVGPVPVAVHDGRAVLTVPRRSEVCGVPAARDAAARLLGLEPAQIVDCACYEAGVPFTLIRVVDRAAVAAAAIDATVLAGLGDTVAPEFYVFTMLENDPQADIHARMFAPALGIAEDPATGGAAAALAGWLPPGAYRIRQGVEMGRESHIHLEVGDTVRIGGAAVTVLRGTLAWDA